MDVPQSYIAEFRQLLNSGRAAVRGMLRMTPNEQPLQAAVRQYDRCFGILDAMTMDEKTSPLTVINANRIRRIARGAGTTDQEVIQFVYSLRDFCEQLSRMSRRDSA